jgi:hypothetical protein
MVKKANGHPVKVTGRQNVSLGGKGGEKPGLKVTSLPKPKGGDKT